MALTENKVIDKIEVVNDWNIQVRQATIIEKDGVQIARTFHRWVLNPDMDISNQEKKVQDIANAAWTPEVRQAYETLKAEQAKMGGQS
jgi:hypothetical protein